MYIGVRAHNYASNLKCISHDSPVFSLNDDQGKLSVNCLPRTLKATLKNPHHSIPLETEYIGMKLWGWQRSLLWWMGDQLVTLSPKNDIYIKWRFLWFWITYTYYHISSNGYWRAHTQAWNSILMGCSSGNAPRMPFIQRPINKNCLIADSQAADIFFSDKN